MKTVILFSLLILNLKVNAQPTEFKTIFHPQTITYNGSDNPNECDKSIAYGVLIGVGASDHFFLLPTRQYEFLKIKLANEEVLIEVRYFDEPTEDSYAFGNVIKIIWKGEIVFTNNL